MSNLAKLKQELGFSCEMEDIIDVLKSAALIQFHSFKGRELFGGAFLREVEVSLRLIANAGINSSYLLKQDNLPSAIVLITSDEGFLGELDILLVNAAVSQRKAKEDEIIVLGERGALYLKDLGENFMLLPGISSDVQYKEADNLSNYLMKEYSARFSELIFVFPEFISLTSQKIRVLHLLPFNVNELKEKPVAGSDMIFEPSQERVIDGLIRLWAGAKIFEIFASAKQSEYAARVLHLEGSSQELSYLNQKLAFEYSRLTHAHSDKSIREISSSKMILGKAAG